ncbi:2-succinyl-5-enolpyruvyl-6-hydroxy-3-cyclohexene-1-carboxylic-acid synthase [Hymenobacter rubripertinctus]
MSSLQAVHNIPEICARHGITDVVLSPGSRSAPLTLAFARHPAYQGKLRVVPDERAAAFIALGIAQATRRPVVLVCTSGTAGLNYAPAVAEAFFQQIPLLILTADRPPEWIDQLDGQTIRQRNLYGAHAKAAFDFPPDTSHPDAKWHAGRIINEAINLTQAAPAGPVQVNIPLREPFYPKEEIVYDQDVKIIREEGAMQQIDSTLAGKLGNLFDSYSRILFVFGQQSGQLWQNLLARKWDDYKLEETMGAVFVGDSISNVTSNEEFFDVTHNLQDIVMAGSSDEQKALLKPELLVTVGLSLISKSLKQFLRQYPAQEHWHIQAAGEVPDTFKCLTTVIRTDPTEGILMLLNAVTAEHLLPEQKRKEREAYRSTWDQATFKASQVLHAENSIFNASPAFGEFVVMFRCLQNMLANTALHLANSMAVRYTNILGIPQGKQIEVFANRGTSGIDGCTSTAVGAALAQPERPVVLLTGDVAFFYDRNAFWHNYPTPNLRVVLFNNHGGGIFRLIDGPRQQPELEEFFETRQTLTAENTARDFGLRYFPVSTFAELDAALPVFFAMEGGAAILEIFTDSQTNAAFFEEYRKAVKTAFA